MSLYRPPQRSEKPLAAVWRALGRHNIGVDHYCDKAGWHFDVDRLHKVGGEWVRETSIRLVGEDDLDVVIQALPDLPGIGVRLALMGVLLRV